MGFGVASSLPTDDDDEAGDHDEGEAHHEEDAVVVAGGHVGAGRGIRGIALGTGGVGGVFDVDLAVGAGVRAAGEDEAAYGQNGGEEC